MTNALTPHQPFLIGSYNILNPYHAVKWRTEEGLNADGKDNWDEGRKAAVLSNIADLKLDICALQEISDRTIEDIKTSFTEGHQMFISTLWKHYTDEPEGAHGVSVLYNPKRFKLVKDEGLQTNQEQYRHAAAVDLQDLLSGCIYRVVSVHLKGYDPYQTDLDLKSESQKRGDLELAEYIKRFTQNLDNINGIFVLGDYNEDAEEMKRRGESSRQGQLIGAGFAWTGVHQVTETRSQRQIDWIFYKDLNENLGEVKYVNIQQNVSASDHALTVVRLE